MNQNVELIEPDGKQMICLNQLKALVHHRRGIDAYLCAHVPIGMRDGLRRCDLTHLVKRERPERAAACRQRDFADMFQLASGKALKNGIMLAIHGQ